MAIFNRQPKHSANSQPQNNVPVIKIDSIYGGLDYLVELVKQIRPSHYKNFAEAELKFKAFFYQLQHDQELFFSLRKALLSQFSNSNIIPALTQSGMVRSRGLIQEMVTKLKHKVLPAYQQQDDILYFINHIFYNKYDYIWVAGIDRSLWLNLFDLLGVQVNVTDEKIYEQLNQALHMLCQRTVTLGLEKEVLESVSLKYHDFPFVQLERAVQSYLQLFYKKVPQEELTQSVRQIVYALYQCRSLIELISEHRKEKGTSLSQTFILFLINQYLERISLIADVLDNDKHFNNERFLEYLIKIIRFEKKKNSLREFLSANFSFLAYKITEHGGQRGEKYITATGKEYWQMIKSAMGGGSVVSVTALIKTLLHKLPMAPFWQGFMYSVNYAASFQYMHETNVTLATKQPAYTASAIATSLDTKDTFGRPDLYSLAITVARTCRSQIASFFGNLIIVFPLSYLLAALYHVCTGELLLNAKEAHTTLVNQHPLLSFSIIYACFTGFFLFLSGIIAGYVENGINYGRVGVRLKNHPVFKNTFSAPKLQKLTSYVENHMGALVGNIALGFFLGMAGFFGTIFGIPFDIRHITIAAANTSIAYYTTGNSEGAAMLLTVFGGVLLIGLFNFLVSFSLAFIVAIKSRGVRLKDFPELVTVMGKFFFRYPKDFFLPPSKLRNIDDVRRKLGAHPIDDLIVVM